ncbi:MAG: segregation and condensation protein A [Burkholderiales bacterium]
MDDNEYKVQIEQFEGPLDLLLHLINKACIDIEDIFVSEVTGQYLSYVSSIPGLSMDSASEFIEMAALLVYIKSRMILPFGDGDEEDEEEEDPEQELIERLKTYKMFKDVCPVLKEYEEKGLRVYYKLPEELALFGERIEIEEIQLQDLVDAYAGVMERIPDGNVERIEEVEIRQDSFTIKERTAFILKKLSEMSTATFFSLFSEARSRMEVAVTFVALLELVHQSVVRISQKNSYEDIYITKISEEAS